jgi:undecaprenyl-diphosphatase
MNIQAALNNLDIAILRYFNLQWTGPGLDQFWLNITHLERQTWFLLIVFPILLAWFVYIYRRGSVKILIAVALAVAISDAFSYRVLKHLIDRPRPFLNPDLKWLRHIGDAHGASFPSNHAANSFAAAMILAWYIPVFRHVVYILAALISISRIALGVHYPSDVLAGAVVGIAVGSLVRSLVLNRVIWFRLHKDVPSADRYSGGWRSRFQQHPRD